MHFAWISNVFCMGFQCMLHGFPMHLHGFPMHFKCIPMHFAWISKASCMVFQCICIGFQCIGNGNPMVSHCLGISRVITDGFSFVQWFLIFQCVCIALDVFALYFHGSCISQAKVVEAIAENGSNAAHLCAVKKMRKESAEEEVERPRALGASPLCPLPPFQRCCRMPGLWFT